MKDIAKTAVVLCAIAVVAGLLLGGVNEFTHMDEAERASRNLAKVYELKDGESFEKLDVPAYVSGTGLARVESVYRVRGKDVYVYQTDSKGFASGLKLSVCVSGGKIAKIAKTAGGETLSKPFTDKNYSRYRGKDLSSVNGFRTKDVKYNKDKPGKDGKCEVDAVTGATLSSNAIAYSLDAVAECHRKITGESGEGGGK